MQQIDRYEVLGELGRGGMASVFLARAPSEELVVLKVPLSNDADSCERLRDEARVGLRLAHPHIVETLDLIELLERPVLVLEYVHGVSLFALRQDGPLPVPAVLHIGRQIADALDALHHATDERGESLGILHRDVTSGNVMIGDDGNARLIDLGIARSAESQAARTRTGCMRGTLRYIAPELFDGEDQSAQSDLWALGVLLLEAALGRPVFPGNDAEAIAAITTSDPLKLKPGEWLDSRVERAVRWLLQRDPAARPSRAREVAALLTMSAKDFDDPRAVSAEWVLRALDEAHVDVDAPSSGSTRELVRHASRVYTDAHSSKEGGRLEPTNMQSRPDIGLGIKPQTGVWFETTEVKASETPSTERLVPLVDAPTLSPHEAILAYARQLRGFEHAARPRYDTSSEIQL